MKLKFTGILIVTLILASCAPAPSIWGVKFTPTPGSNTTRVQAQLIPPTHTPTQIYTATPPGLSKQSPTATFTATPTKSIQVTSPPLSPDPNAENILYYSQSGDTLNSVAAHFGIDAANIHVNGTVPEEGLINPETLMIIPDVLGETSPSLLIMPDSEIVYSATALNFDTTTFAREANGYLYSYKEYLGSSGWITGAKAIDKLALENSINPRLMLALLEYESGWVYGNPSSPLRTDYPMGHQKDKYKGMFSQMIWTVNKLAYGYYGWRDGSLTELTFPDGETIRISPELNAGTVALQYFFSLYHNREEWQQIIDPNIGFPALYTQMFGDPWARAQAVEPLFPPHLKQPDFVLPFEPGIRWSYAGGPHPSWEKEGPFAAIDFAPFTDKGGCDPSTKWVVASAPGLVVRSGSGVVVLDLDGDGHEQTGWSLLYLHIATVDRIPLGQWVDQDDYIGHASCEGGVSTGTHIHFARKYNGEWVLADGPMPFTLSGWVVHSGGQAYEGTMTKGDNIVVSDFYGQSWSGIIREIDEK
ncbi:MAG: peptidoglycan DD-metalloendopeptidase family protein [Anaerolineales bacterium]|nr:peptidoglycan DD-metalloendopeptidase family protein [Anaerolineales bacterium]